MNTRVDRQRILVIEDEAPIRAFLRATLTARGYSVEEAASARAGLLALTSHPPDLVLLDLGLPDGDGLEITKEVRGWSSVPIIVVSARGQERDKVAVLDAGADDYLTKPFGVGELTARIGVALRHAQRLPGTEQLDAIYEATAGAQTLRVDLTARRIHMTRAGVRHEIRLTPTEFRLLALLVKHAGRVLTHQQILGEVLGPEHLGDVQYLRVYAGQLRKKLEADSAQPRFLITEPGIGYRLLESGASEA